MPDLMAELAVGHVFGARALAFTILTASRSGEVRGATWSEIDLEAGIWVIPANRMKAAKEHRIPLSSAAIEQLGERRSPLEQIPIIWSHIRRRRSS
jgi:integrase